MTGDASRAAMMTDAAAVRAPRPLLRTVAITAGIGWAVAFIVVGVGYGLQMYGDGSIFSYAVAVEDAWAIHAHNISGRMFVFLACLFPAESYVTLTGDARGGIVLYGLLFFAAPLSGLALTFVADRAERRVFFAFACVSTACLAPLVFGFPTETWVAHALFWPALALSHCARPTVAGGLAVFAVLLALAFTHEGALIFEAAILATLLPRGLREPRFLRAVAAFAVILAIWVAIKLTLRPDAYIAGILMRAAQHVFDLAYLTNDVSVMLLAGLVGYAALFAVFLVLSPSRAHLLAAAIVTALLALYWVRYDRTLLTDGRYYLRTAVLVGTPAFGVLAALFVLAQQSVARPITWLATLLARPVAQRAAFGALALVLLVHVVETAEFVLQWSRYTAAVRRLAMSGASDPPLGDPRFVSADRIGTDLKELSWNSTTPFLSVLVSPDFAPRRLVIDPSGSYFWLSCKTATAIKDARRAIPVASRELIRVHACEHRS